MHLYLGLVVSFGRGQLQASFNSAGRVGDAELGDSLRRRRPVARGRPWEDPRRKAPLRPAFQPENCRRGRVWAARSRPATTSWELRPRGHLMRFTFGVTKSLFPQIADPGTMRSEPRGPTYVPDFFNQHSGNCLGGL